MCGTYITFNKSYWEMTGLLETILIMMIVMKTQPLPWCGRVPCHIKRIGLTLIKSTSALKIPLVQIYGPSFTLNERKKSVVMYAKKKKICIDEKKSETFWKQIKSLLSDNVVQRQGKVRVDIFKDRDLTGMVWTYRQRKLHGPKNFGLGPSMAAVGSNFCFLAKFRKKSTLYVHFW